MNDNTTLFDKVWDRHVIARLDGGADLLAVDRTFLHDLSGTRAIRALTEEGRGVREPSLTFASPDHAVSTASEGRHEGERYDRCVAPLKDLSRQHGIRYFDVGSERHGIIHVIGPEQGLTLPGSLIVCGDSHTSTHGGLGALAWGIGVSEIKHVLATGTIRQSRPKTLRVRFEGSLGPGVTPKDMILSLIGRDGTAAADGFAVEYAGSAIEAMPVEGRMTVCNLSIEMGAKIGMIAPDETTFAYLVGREHAPSGETWERAVDHWRSLVSDDGAVFDKEVNCDVSAVEPQVTWGTSPEQVSGVGGTVPDPEREPDANRRKAMAAALEYAGLKPGTRLADIAIDRVFIGSCTNGRLSDLREAAALLTGRKVAEGVEAWAVPGSEAVKRAAEAEGLDRVFADAGFHWRQPGCSLCASSNGDTVAPGQRCVSTSNRNFVGRQGKGSRTHLASPVTAAAAAVTGHITDPRGLMEGGGG